MEVPAVRAAVGGRLGEVALVLGLVREDGVASLRELSARSGLSRKVVTHRIGELLHGGVVVDAGAAHGRRAPRELRFGRDAGRVLVAHFGATGLGVGIADLAGRVLRRRHEPHDIRTGPEVSLARVEELFDELLTEGGHGQPPVWGVGIGLPGPVEFGSGRPIAPPIMPGWDEYPVRGRLAERFGVPVWVDNEVNLMALGELRSGAARGAADFVYVKIGTGIGAGLVSRGELHRGAAGVAGDIGHVAVHREVPVVCHCGKRDCLEALAGGAAIARDGRGAAEDGRSARLAGRLAKTGEITAHDVAGAAHAGDATAIGLLDRSGRLVGEVLSALVNFYNPELVVIGGGVAAAGDLVLAAVRQVVYERSLPRATRDLRITRSGDSERVGLVGAGYLAVDQLFGAGVLAHWIGRGSPVGMPELAEVT